MYLPWAYVVGALERTAREQRDVGKINSNWKKWGEKNPWNTKPEQITVEAELSSKPRREKKA